MSYPLVKVKKEKTDDTLKPKAPAVVVPPPVVVTPSTSVPPEAPLPVAKKSAPKIVQDDPPSEPTPSASTTELSAFEKRMFELGKEFPKGIPDKIVQNDMPSISPADRAAAINKLLIQGRIDLYKQGNDILYRVVSDKEKGGEPDQIRDADKEEKVVFDIIKDASNMGIWIRDIRVRSNLTMPQLNKIVKSLENKKLIKAVKSVAASKKKVFMLYGLEPHRSLTGGAWYSDQDFESEFVTVLNQQCFKYLNDKRQQALSQPDDFGPLKKWEIAMTTLDDLWKFISNLGISKVDLTKEDIASILSTLIYDGKVEKIIKADMEYYVAVEPSIETTGIIQVPCGVCPVAKDCSERGSVNPTSCIYLGTWLGADLL